MKITSLGEKYEETACAGKSPEEKFHYPSVYITDKQMPDLKDYKLNDTCMLQLEGVIVGMDKHNDNPISFRIELRKGGIKG